MDEAKYTPPGAEEFTASEPKESSVDFPPSDRLSGKDILTLSLAETDAIIQKLDEDIHTRIGLASGLAKMGKLRRGEDFNYIQGLVHMENDVKRLQAHKAELAKKKTE